MNRPERRPRRSGPRPQKQEMIYGRHPVHSALRSEKRAFDTLYLLESARGEGIREIIEEAGRLALPVTTVNRAAFERLTGPGVPHQGVVLCCREQEAPHWKEVLERFRGQPGAVVVFADRVEDTRNLGAMIRSAVAFGAGALIASRARTAPLEASGVKASAGSLESIDVLQLNNFADVLHAFRKAGYWIVALDGGGERVLWETDLTSGPLGMVIGGEDQGIRQRVIEMSDWTVRVPVHQSAHSLNASVALGVALYEVRRQQAVSRPGKTP